MKVSRTGWGVAFIPPEVVELMRDYVMSGKGDRLGFSKLDRIPSYAVEEFLYREGYTRQIAEVRKAREQKREAKSDLDKLSERQRDTVVLLMNERGLTQGEATEWVLSHKEELKQ